MTQIPDNLPAGTTHFCPAFGRHPERALRLEPCDKWSYWTGFSWFDLLHAPPPSVRREAIDLRRPRAGQAYATWNDEGLPPVGLEVEIKLKSTRADWCPATVLFCQDDALVIAWKAEGVARPTTLSAVDIRPIRTAEERERQVAGIDQAFRSFVADRTAQERGYSGHELANHLYNAGARMPGEGSKA